MPLPVPASSDGPPPHASRPRTRQRWALYRGSPNAFADRHSNLREWSAEERGRLINQNGYKGEAAIIAILGYAALLVHFHRWRGSPCAIHPRWQWPVKTHEWSRSGDAGGSRQYTFVHASINSYIMKRFLFVPGTLQEQPERLGTCLFCQYPKYRSSAHLCECGNTWFSCAWSERRVLHRCADSVMKGRQPAHDARVPDSASDNHRRY
jgi:hypothetical protein